MSIHEQLNLIAEAVVLRSLPVCFTSNRSLHHFSSGYNEGTYPYGLGDKAGHRNMQAKYEKVIANITKGISMSLPSNMLPYHLDANGDKADIFKYCRFLVCNMTTAVLGQLKLF